MIFPDNWNQRNPVLSKQWDLKYTIESCELNMGESLTLYFAQNTDILIFSVFHRLVNGDAESLSHFHLNNCTGDTYYYSPSILQYDKAEGLPQYQISTWASHHIAPSYVDPGAPYRPLDYLWYRIGCGIPDPLVVIQNSSLVSEYWGTGMLTQVGIYYAERWR